AAISYDVTILNAEAPVVISSEMVVNEPSTRVDGLDPRQATLFAGKVLHNRASYANDCRIVLCHATEKSRMTLACASDHAFQTACQYGYKSVYSEDSGQVVFTIEAQPGCPIHLAKYMVYHTSQTASAEELCGRAEWTLDRIKKQGAQELFASQEQYMNDFWRR